MSKIPAYYIPHGGGPCFFMDWNPPNTWHDLGAWLGSHAAALPEKPRAVLYFSAHWEEPQFTLLTTPKPALYYDYYDFPPHTYDLHWPAPAADLRERVRELTGKAGLNLAEDSTRDYDHGVFVPGLLAFPQADVPVAQISLKRGLDPREHLALGRALAPLRHEGVLFVGSGMSFHNMRVFRFGSNELIPGSEEFDTWLTETVCHTSPAEREERLAHWEQAPGARFAHPREEHLIPLMVIAGSAQGASGSMAWHGRAMGAPLSAYELG
ncbi:MAG: class III extradiol ring-cleavage dioxygenase [Desulfovibrio sp.]|nr:class III extradiol ring-cleavage dioxygenase [Desulfovibrio sp.]